MADHGYSTADITVHKFDVSVRVWPGMYFGVGPDDPGLLTMVLSAVARHVLHPATTVAQEHSLSAVIEILGDLRLTVTVDQQHAWTDSPARGYFGSLLGSEWWLLAAVAALCDRTSVEMWCDGRGFAQVLAGLRPIGAVREFDPPAGSGTRVTFTLDPQNLPLNAALPADLEGIDVHRPDCIAADGPGHAIIRDRRDTDATANRS